MYMHDRSSDSELKGTVALYSSKFTTSSGAQQYKPPKSPCLQLLYCSKSIADLKANCISSCLKWTSSSRESTASVRMLARGRNRLLRLLRPTDTTCTHTHFCCYDTRNRAVMTAGHFTGKGTKKLLNFVALMKHVKNDVFNRTQ